ncbi:polysaccharide deacetylase family protein [uncultured Microbacterium sp.]|uniref:polysaccharide deacetylase family protein n=1 Tax=uncultured Microbacterium sp. TaxID=191216 RepID=UPI0035CC6E7A
METTRRARRGPSARVRRRRRLFAVTGIAIFAIAAVVVITLAVPRFVTASASNPEGSSEAAPSASPTADPEYVPSTEAQRLLAEAQDPRACAVTFVGDGVTTAPVLEIQDTLYAHLPIPARDGLVFAGWYTSPADAAAFNIGARINGADAVACTDNQITLNAAWKTPEENAAEDAKIPILMYHQFTTNPDGESGWLRGNYAYIGDFDAQMNHIATTGFYLPTWQELSAFVDGRLFLPNHSVIVTDDDADQSWFDLAAPIVGKYKLLTTSFMITAYRQDPPPNIYVLRRSHTNDMHQAGDNGKGRMVNWSADQIAADLEQSAAVLGVKEVIAYPFGHYNDTAKQGVTQAGFEMARTIEPGYVAIGTDKLALPVVRINYGMGLTDLINEIG